MFIFTEPYISDLVKDFINSDNGDNILQNDFLADYSFNNQPAFLTENDAAEKLASDDGRWIYSNTENALVLLNKILPANHRLRKCIELFKNKSLFRQRYKDIFPGVSFLTMSLNDLLNFKFSDFGSPFIIKPAVGFLSAGVYRVNSQQELTRVQTEIVDEMDSIAGVFPKSVLDSSKFLIESVIEGREFAIDAYFDDNSEPVIINIFEHIFRDNADMSDRLYTCSTTIIKEWLEPFTDFLHKLQSITDLPGFALHAEVRVTASGEILPIEVNPLRFAGWCCTDLCYWAYGINPYTYFATKQKPDWQQLCAEDDGKIYGMSVISSQHVKTAKDFNYNALAEHFSDIKEIRRIDFTSYPLFGFAFFAVDKSDSAFLNWLLNEDFKDFCIF